MSNFEEQFGIFLVGTPHQTPVFPQPPNPIHDPIWLEAVRNDLRKINETRVGNALLRAIKRHGVVITIQPHQPGECGDGTWPVDGDIPTGNPDHLKISQGVSIWFSPENHDINHKCEARHKVFGAIRIESHEVLLHELVHALRMVSFKLRKVGVGKGFAFFNTNEEIYAVLVQGIYASERGTRIRGSHRGHFPIDKQLEGSFDFFKTGTEAFDHVKRFCIENPGFTKMIAQVYTKFNPIRAYYYDPNRARRMSKTSLAKSRDKIAPVIKDGLDFMIRAYRQAGISRP